MVPGLSTYTILSEWITALTGARFIHALAFPERHEREACAGRPRAVPSCVIVSSYYRPHWADPRQEPSFVWVLATEVNSIAAQRTQCLKRHSGCPQVAQMRQRSAAWNGNRRPFSREPDGTGIATSFRRGLYLSPREEQITSPLPLLEWQISNARHRSPFSLERVVGVHEDALETPRSDDHSAPPRRC